jgi:hypothetical protein
MRGSSQRRDWNGAIAQLGERLDGIQEVVGSIPTGSTSPSPLRGYGWQANLPQGWRNKLGFREAAKAARRSPTSAFTRVFDALWGEGGPDRICSDP